MEANLYLIKYDNTIIIIDPCIDYNKICKYIDGKIDAILLTHGHFDHFEALDSYLNKNIPFYMHKDAYKKISSPVQNCSRFCNLEYIGILTNEKVYLIDEETKSVKIKNIDIKVMNTFGHTNCSLTYIIDNLMFTGDFLFKRSIGRTDLPTGNEVMMRLSLNKIKTLKDNYDIYSGHC